MTEAAERQEIRVLLVEDDEVNREIESLMLERLGFTVDVVRDGAAAVTAAASGRLLRDPHGLPPARHGRLPGDERDPQPARRPACGCRSSGSPPTPIAAAASRPAWTTSWRSPSLSTHWRKR